MNSRGLFDLSENLLYILFIYLFFAVWILVAVQTFLQLWQLGAALQLWCVSFSLWCLLLLGSPGSRECGLQQLLHTGSVVAAHRLQSKSSLIVANGFSCPTWGMWELPRPGIEPTLVICIARWILLKRDKCNETHILGEGCCQSRGKDIFFSSFSAFLDMKCKKLGS